MTYQTIPPSSSGGGACANPVDVAISRAQELLGDTVDAVFGTHFEDDDYKGVFSGAGAPSAILSQTHSAGVLKLSSSVTASTQVILRLKGVAQPAGTEFPASHIDNAKTSPWYAEWNMAFGTTIDAQAYLSANLLGVGGGNSAAIYFGAIGGRSTANWGFEVYSNAGALVGSGTALPATDLNFHLVQIYNDLTNFNFAVDGTVILQHAVATANTPTNALALGAYCGNGTTAAERTMFLDSMYICCVSN